MNDHLAELLGFPVPTQKQSERDGKSHGEEESEQHASHADADMDEQFTIQGHFPELEQHRLGTRKQRLQEDLVDMHQMPNQDQGSGQYQGTQPFPREFLHRPGFGDSGGHHSEIPARHRVRCFSNSLSR